MTSPSAIAAWSSRAVLHFPSAHTPSFRVWEDPVCPGSPKFAKGTQRRSLIRTAVTGKSPAILYCHWHGGEYDIGKEELFQAKHTSEAPGPAFAKRGFVVLAIDAYCFGERNGQGPGGEAEKGSAGEMTASKFNL